MKRIAFAFIFFMMTAFAAIPTSAQTSCQTPSWITAGASAQITPGTPNRVRTQPSQSGQQVFELGHPTQSTGRPTERGTFTIIQEGNQPLVFCPEGSSHAWIKIDYQGAVYYTAIYSLNNPNEVWVMPAPPVQQVQETPQQELVETCTEMLNLPQGGTYVSILVEQDPPLGLHHTTNSGVISNIIVALPVGSILSLDYQQPRCDYGYTWYQAHVVASGNETVEGWFAAGRTSGELFVNKFSN